jgi:curved DNA-binding protein CbpA
MFHQFSLDPRSVLGVPPNASTEEIHRAFLAKSKLYHPDHGGDEWAFKMVLRAYEILKATGRISARQEPAPQHPAEPARPNRVIHPEAESTLLGEFRTVDAELVWIRCEGSPIPLAGLEKQPVAMTLSVCLVISWPQVALVKRSTDIPGAADLLRDIIQAFDHLKGQAGVIDTRSRIEDGQFVGWLSYPSVLQAEAAFQALHDELVLHELGINLRTRDEHVPVDWLED